MAALDELSCTFDTHVTTEMRAKHRLKWTVKDFFKLPNEKEIMSPDIKANPPYVWHLNFKKDPNNVYLYFVNTSNEKLEINYELSFYDMDGKCRYHVSPTRHVFEHQKKHDLLPAGVLKELQSLKDDTLIIVCNFDINEVTTRINKTRLQGTTLQKYTGLNKLSADWKVLFDNHQHTDINLIVDGHQLPCHKSTLCARSPVFEKMFQHRMEEEDQSEVHIDDVKFPSLKKLVDFLYCGIVDAEEDAESAYALYYAADKYEVLDLQKMCSKTLLSKCTIDNAIQVLTWADRHRDNELKSNVLNFISKNFHLIVESQIWESFVTSETKLAAQVVNYCAKWPKF